MPAATTIGGAWTTPTIAAAAQIATMTVPAANRPKSTNRQPNGGPAERRPP